MKKKWLALLIGASMLMGTLTACGSGEAASESGQSQASQTQSQETGTQEAAAGTGDASGTTDFGGAEISVWVPPYASSDAAQNAFTLKLCLGMDIFRRLPRG